MRTTPHYATLDGYQSSTEILAAIEEVAGDEFAADNDETEAHRVWADPTDEEMARVIAIAWTLADADVDTLTWGIEVVRRRS